MKTVNKIICCCLALLLIAAMPVYAGAEATGKEEVIYAMLSPDGSVSDVYAVNIFDKGSVTDYGDYSSVRNMTTTDALAYSDGKITCDAGSRLYYEGKMKNTEFPWRFTVRYFIGGNEYSASDVAGKSGRLEIRFTVEPGDESKRSFYDSYGVTAAFRLDTDKCAGITAEGATVANVGSSKQLSYTILPGQGGSFSITADVTDFEMEAVTINCVRMSLSLSLSEEQLALLLTPVTGKLGELADGAVQLNTGAKTVKSYSYQIKNGAEQLSMLTEQLGMNSAMFSTSLSSFAEKAEAAGASAEALSEAVKKAGALLASVDTETEKIKKLLVSSGAIGAKLGDILSAADGIGAALSYDGYKREMKAEGIDIDALLKANAESIASLKAELESLKAEYAASSGYAAEALSVRISQTEELIALLIKNTEAINGAGAYIEAAGKKAVSLKDSVSALRTGYTGLNDGINELASELLSLSAKLTGLKDIVTELNGKVGAFGDGSSQLSLYAGLLVSSYAGMNDSLSLLADGMKKLYDGASQLYDGTSTLYGYTSLLSDSVSAFSGDSITETAGELISSAMEELTGGNAGTVSFVSEKNTRVTSVQFAVKYPAVKIPSAAEEKPENIEESTFWDKLKALFS